MYEIFSDVSFSNQNPGAAHVRVYSIYTRGVNRAGPDAGRAGPGRAGPGPGRVFKLRAGPARRAGPGRA